MLFSSDNIPGGAMFKTVSNFKDFNKSKHTKPSKNKRVKEKKVTTDALTYKSRMMGGDFSKKKYTNDFRSPKAPKKNGKIFNFFCLNFIDLLTFLVSKRTLTDRTTTSKYVNEDEKKPKKPLNLKGKYFNSSQNSHPSQKGLTGFSSY